MWKYKSCPRCKGDIFIDEDLDGIYIKCLQCGYERELARDLLAKKNQVAFLDQEPLGVT